MQSFFLIVVPIGSALAQHNESNTFNLGIQPTTPEALQAEKLAEEAWFTHLKVLAGDELKGRKTGTPEFLKAVEYVESQFKTIGLKPAGVNGFEQPVGF